MKLILFILIIVGITTADYAFSDLVKGMFESNSIQYTNSFENCFD